MEIELRLQVTSDLCCEIVRNAAYYKSGWNTPGDIKKPGLDFWVNLNGNFLDTAVLTWCYLFGDKKAEFKWQKLVKDPSIFIEKMLHELKYTNDKFENYIKIMRSYRDKRVAHRDIYVSSSPKLKYPDLDIAIDSTVYLFNELYKIYPSMDELYSKNDLKVFYTNRLEHGNQQYLP